MHFSLKSNKTLKKICSWLLITAGIYLLLLIAASIYANANKEKFTGIVTDALKKSITGQVHIRQADISVWRFFPRFGVVLYDVSVTDSVYNQPFLKMKEIDVRFGLFDLIGSSKSIGSLKCIDGTLFSFTDTSGYANKYVITPKTKSSKSGGKLDLKNVELENVSFISVNSVKHKRFEILALKLDADISREDSNYTIHLNEKCLVRQLGFNRDKGSYLKNQMIEAKWLLQYSAKDASISFGETKTSINKQPFILSGTFWLRDQGHFKINASTKKFSWQQAMQMVPENIYTKLKNVQINKPLDVTVAIDGPMAYKTIPAVHINWLTKNNQVVTPVVVLDSCSFSGNFTNEKVKGQPLTDENSEMSITGFTGKWGAIPLSGETITITNLKAPNLRFKFYSHCEFPALNDQLALRTIHFIEGKAQLYLEYNGPVIPDPALLNKLGIHLAMQNGKVEYVPRSMVFTNCNGDILFSENALQVNKLECDLKQNHFSIRITGNDMNKFSDSIAGKGSISCSVTSPSINLSDFTSLFSPTQKTASASKSKQPLRNGGSAIDNILEQGTVSLNLNAGHVFMNRFDAKNVRAQLQFGSNSWNIQQASLQHAGGSLRVEAEIIETGGAFQPARIKAQTENIDIRKLFYSFNNFGQTGLEHQNLKGVINATANVSMQLNQKGAVVPKSISGTVDFSVKNGALVNYAPLQNIKTFILKNRDLSNIEFAELHDKLEIKNNEIRINRMEIESSVLTVFVEGLYSLGGNTDISLQVPLSNLKKRKEGYTPKNAGVDAKMGPSVYLRVRPDKSGQLKVGLDVFKKLRKEDQDALDRGEQ